MRSVELWFCIFRCQGPAGPKFCSCLHARTALYPSLTRYRHEQPEADSLAAQLTNFTIILGAYALYPLLKIR